MRLSDEKMKKLDADIIVLDEFHHCGAPEWGNGINRLIQRNPNANILGLSATPIRYFDGLRDMAEELFENNVASEMTLEEAIERGILPEATYVSTLYGYDEELERMQSNIDKIRDENKKEQAQVLFDSLNKKLDENTRNLPEILVEYMKNKTGKYVIFCRNIQDMKEKMKQANEMFGSVNPNIKVRGVASNIKNNDKILSEFENDNDEGTLKLLYAVDMVNEGYHIKDIDGVVMMRPTFSPTIFTQQLGRALTVGGEKKPVVLDLVNNFDTCKIIEDFTERMRKYKGRESKRAPQETTKSRISIFDKTKEFRDIASKITELSKRDKISLEDKIEIFERFSKIDEELTGSTMFEGYPVGQWAIQIRSSIKRMNEGKKVKVKINPSEKQLDRLDKLGILERQIDSTIDEKIEALVEWMKKYPKAQVSKNVLKEILKEYAETDEEYEAIVSEYEKMKKYYDYAKYRKYEKKLTKEQISKCKEGNVGGVFGYSSYIEKLAKKFKQEEKTIYNIISNYGTIDNLKNLYENDKINKNDLKLVRSILREATLIDVDFNSNEGYNKLYEIMAKDLENKTKIYSSKKLEEMIETLNPREQLVIKRRFGLSSDGIDGSLDSISRELRVTRERIRQIEAKAMRKLNHPTRYNRYKGYFVEDLKSSSLLSTDEIDCIDRLLKYCEDKDLSKGLPEDKKDISPEILKIIEKTKNIFSEIPERIKENKAEERRKTFKEEFGMTIEEYMEKTPVPLEDLSFSVRTYNCLKRAGINTLNDITKLMEEDLTRIRNFREKEMKEVKNALKEYGLSLYDSDGEEEKNNSENFEETQKNFSKSEVEEAREKRDKLQTQIEEMQSKIKEMKELMNAYDKLLEEDKITGNNNEAPDFKDE